MMNVMTKPLTCTFPGCDAPRASRWRCTEHYASASGPCSVDECSGRHYGKGLCKFHYGRQVDGRPLDAPKFVPTKACTFAGCGKAHCSRGLCKTHYDRAALWGDPAISKARPVPPARSGPSNPAWKGDAAGYHAVHKRLITARGKASGHTCSCGKPASQWAYDGEDPNQMTQVIRAGGREITAPFSHDLSHYLPMCARCHIAYDRKLPVA